MAITVYENKEASSPTRVKLDRRVYSTGAGKLVEHGHPEAATLYGSAGKEVSRAEFEAMGGETEPYATARPGPSPDKPVAVEPKPKAKRKATKRKTTKGK